VFGYGRGGLISETKKKGRYCHTHASSRTVEKYKKISLIRRGRTEFFGIQW